MKDPPVPKPFQPDEPSEVKQVLSGLEEVDAYVQQLKVEHQQELTSQPGDGKGDRAQKSPPAATTRAQAANAQAWIQEHAAALEARRQQLDEQATAQEIGQSQLTDMRLQLVQESQKLKQEWESLAREKRQFAGRRAPLGDEVQALPQEKPRAGQRQDPERADMSDQLQQKQQIKAQRQQIERAWAVLKKEKAALVQARRRLKLKSQSLTQETYPTGPSVTEGRLDHHRQQLQDQIKQLRAGEAVVDLARQQYAELLEQRQTLLEVKRYLAGCEGQMIRRWSTGRSVGLVGGVVSCLLLLLLLSFEVGHRVVDPVWRARTVVGITATVFDESRYGSAWVAKQHEALVSQEVLSDALRFGVHRGVRLFDDVNQMRQALGQGLSVELQSPGKILFAFEHVDKQLAVDLLKALGRAWVNHHTMQDRVSGRSNSMRMYEAAACDAKPIQDHRPFAVFMTLMVSSTSVVVLALLLRWWLSRSVSVFEQRTVPELEQVEDPECWPTEPAQEKRFTVWEQGESTPLEPAEALDGQEAPVAVQEDVYGDDKAHDV